MKQSLYQNLCHGELQAQPEKKKNNTELSYCLNLQVARSSKYYKPTIGNV